MELLNFVERINKDALKVTTEDFQGTHENIVTRADIAKYWSGDAHNISSGCRQLGDITGDWRPINDLAELLASIFEELNKEV